MTMKTNKSLLRLRSLLPNVQVHLSMASYTKVNMKWRHMNMVPDFNRLYYIVEGEGGLIIDGETYYPRPGQLFVMPSGVKQSYFVTTENTFGKYWCHFTAKIGDTDLFRLTGMPYFIDVADRERLSRLFVQLIEHYNSDEFSAVLMQKAVLLEIVSFFIDGAMQKQELFRPVKQDRGLENLNSVLKYIEQHLHENVTVQQLADLVHFHPNYLIRQFHELVGSSPIQYIQRLKMDTAKTWLTTADEPVSDIASKVGMELYYFSRIFKKHTGLSPTEYRQTVRQQ